MRTEIHACQIHAITDNAFLKVAALFVSAQSVLLENTVRHVTRAIQIHAKLANVSRKVALSFASAHLDIQVKGKFSIFGFESKEKKKA